MADNQWAIENCALAAENLMLAACAEGRGTCWIGFAQMWLVTRAGKAALGVPPAYVPVAPIIVGHPKSPPPPVPRSLGAESWATPSRPQPLPGDASLAAAVADSDTGRLFMAGHDAL